MPLDPASIGIAAGINAAAPFIAKGIGGLFGLDEESDEEKRAAARRQDTVNRLTAAAEGRTPSAAQLAGIAQQQRTQLALQGLAQRGSVQQRAGNVRAAMQAAPEVMAQQGAQLAATRAAEMESARNALAQAQMGIANQEAAQGAARRQYMQGLIGAAIGGAASATTMGLKPDEKQKDGQEQAASAKPTAGGYGAMSEEQQKADIMGYGTAGQAQTAEPRGAIRRTGMGATRGAGMQELSSEPYAGTPMMNQMNGKSGFGDRVLQQATDAGVDIGKPGMMDLYMGSAAYARNTGANMRNPYQLQFGAPQKAPAFMAGEALTLGGPYRRESTLTAGRHDRFGGR